MEQQADCFAGGFTRYLASGDARLHLKGGELDVMLAIQLGVRDPVGGVPTEQGFVARGNGFDLVRAFKDGFVGGATECGTYFEDPSPSTTILFRNSEEEATRGDLPDTQMVAVTIDGLNDFYGKVEPAYEPLTADDVVLFDSTGAASELPECGGSTPNPDAVANRLYFCLADGYVAGDRDYLQRVYDRIGDFGVASLLAHVFATYVQTLQGFPGVRDNSRNALLGADCYTGAFAGAMVEGLTSAELEPVGEPQVVSLSPGDLDEMLFAAIDHDKISGVKQTADFTFRRVATLEDGFFGGYESCAVFAGG